MKQIEKQHWYNKIRQLFLLSFFDKENKYQEKEINGFYLIKRFNADLSVWEVAIYTYDTYRKMKTKKERIKHLLKPRGNKQERG